MRERERGRDGRSKRGREKEGGMAGVSEGERKREEGGRERDQKSCFQLDNNTYLNVWS